MPDSNPDIVKAVKAGVDHLKTTGASVKFNVDLMAPTTAAATALTNAIDSAGNLSGNQMTRIIKVVLAEAHKEGGTIIYQDTSGKPVTLGPGEKIPDNVKTVTYNSPASWKPASGPLPPARAASSGFSLKSLATVADNLGRGLREVVLGATGGKALGIGMGIMQGTGVISGAKKLHDEINAAPVNELHADAATSKKAKASAPKMMG